MFLSGPTSDPLWDPLPDIGKTPAFGPLLQPQVFQSEVSLFTLSFQQKNLWMYSQYAERRGVIRDVEDVTMHARLNFSKKLKDVDGLIETTAQCNQFNFG